MKKVFLPKKKFIGFKEEVTLFQKNHRKIIKDLWSKYTEDKSFEELYQYMSSDFIYGITLKVQNENQQYFIGVETESELLDNKYQTIELPLLEYYEYECTGNPEGELRDTEESHLLEKGRNFLGPIIEKYPPGDTKSDTYQSFLYISKN